MKITIQLLCELNACPSQVIRFSQLYPDGVSYETPEELQLGLDKASKQGLDVVWFIEKMKLSCVCRRYYKNGLVWYEDNYKNGKQDGTWRGYYGSGQLRYESNSKHGKRNGICRKYYESGQLEYDGNYKDGEPDGVWRDYYESGQLNYEDNYKNGKRDGVCRGYYENGQLKREENYKDGELVKETQ